MKLLFDHNLSPRLVDRLVDIYPNSSHLYLLGLDTANDNLVWEYALDHDYVIVTKDSDFNELTLIRGFPPKIVWIRFGNCTTSQVERLLRTYNKDIKALIEDPSLGILSIYY